MAYLDTNKDDQISKEVRPASINLSNELHGIRANYTCPTHLSYVPLQSPYDRRVVLQEWVSFLFDLFQFMSRTAFDKHVEELINTVSRR